MFKDEILETQKQVDEAKEAYDWMEKGKKAGKIAMGVGITSFLYLGFRELLGTNDIEGFTAIQQGVLYTTGLLAKVAGVAGSLGGALTVFVSEATQHDIQDKLSELESKLEENKIIAGQSQAYF